MKRIKINWGWLLCGALALEAIMIFVALYMLFDNIVFGMGIK